MRVVTVTRARGRASVWSVWSVLLLATLAGSAVAQAPRGATSNVRAQAIRAEMAAVMLQSRRYHEAAREYRVLLAADPTNVSYRLALARALAWGSRPREAEAEIGALMALRGSDPALEQLLVAVRGQLRPSSSEAAGWLRERPGTLEYRQMLARALAREHRTTEALAQYDTLVSWRPSPAHFLERAYVHVDRRDYAAAQRDVGASMQLGPSAAALVLAGDMYRWRGDYLGARAAYQQARRLPPNGVDMDASFARLARDERPVIGLLPDVSAGDAPGWHGASATTGDNLGVNLTSTTLRRGMRWRAFDASAGAATRWLTDKHASPTAPSGPSAFGGDVALSREASKGRLYGRARARAGLMYHPEGDAVPEGGVAAVAFMDAWGLGFDLSLGPAYPGLLTYGAFLPSPVTGEQLREQSSTLSIGGPLFAVDVAGSWQSTALSDGNLRATFQGLARYPVREHIALVYSASVLSFAQPSALYWSPDRYVAHAVGPELSLNRPRGWSASLRVLPGGAWSEDRPAPSAGIVRTSALQLTAGGGVSYRAAAWELGGGASYGRGRAGSYERFDASVYLRVAP